MAVTSATKGVIVLDESWVSELCETWRSWQHLKPVWAVRNELIVHSVERYCGRGAVVVDAGCGPGADTVAMHARLASDQMIGIDVDPVLIECAQRYARDTIGLSFICNDLGIESTMASLGTVDAVISVATLHWLRLPALQAFYRGAAKALRTDGLLIVSCELPRPEPEQSAEAHELAMDFMHRAELPQQSWNSWWESARAREELKPAFDRRRDYLWGSNFSAPDWDGHIAAMVSAGFTRPAEVLRCFDSGLFLAARL